MRKNQFSLLRWAGSKRQLVPVLSEYWNDNFKKYIEPFAGSAQLFFEIHGIESAVLSDKNQGLIEMYQQVQKSPYEVHRILSSFENNSKEYYRLRSLDPRTLGKNQRAARFIYLNWLCFNGLYRTNNSGQFNVPYSGNEKKSINNWQLVKQVSKKLQNVILLADDFENVVLKHSSKDTLVYLDPPYAIENERIFTQYCNNTFGLKDLDRLRELLIWMDKRRTNFLLSYIDTPQTRKIFSCFPIKSVEVQRNISGFSVFRRKSKEILVSNIK